MLDLAGWLFTHTHTHTHTNKSSKNKKTKTTSPGYPALAGRLFPSPGKPWVTKTVSNKAQI